MNLQQLIALPFCSGHRGGREPLSAKTCECWSRNSFDEQRMRADCTSCNTRQDKMATLTASTYTLPYSYSNNSTTLKVG